MNSETNTVQTDASERRKAMLSTAWVFVILNMLLRDVHEIFRPGFLEEVMTGTVGSIAMTEEFLLVAAFIVEIPVAMVVLCRLLKRGANRWANLIVGPMVIIAVITNGAADLDDIFFGAVQVIALSVIIWSAWTWKDPNSVLATQPEMGGKP